MEVWSLSHPQSPFQHSVSIKIVSWLCKHTLRKPQTPLCHRLHDCRAALVNMNVERSNSNRLFQSVTYCKQGRGCVCDTWFRSLGYLQGRCIGSPLLGPACPRWALHKPPVASPPPRPNLPSAGAPPAEGVVASLQGALGRAQVLGRSCLALLSPRQGVAGTFS